MNPQILLNGNDISTYKLMPIDGTLATVLTPPKYKKLVSNASSFIHGENVISSPESRRLDKQDISLTFLLMEDTLANLKIALDDLEQTLIQGKNNSGVNELTFPDVPAGGEEEEEDSCLCLRLVYTEMSKFTPWQPHGKAIVTLKFVEPNPNNRAS